MDSDIGLSDRDKELKRWNAPYTYREFPKMLFRGTTTTLGRVEVEQRIVSSGREEQDCGAVGWLASPRLALERETTRQESVGLAAAERAWDDRRMSAPALAEVEAVEATSAKHLPEIPEASQRKRPPRRTP